LKDRIEEILSLNLWKFDKREKLWYNYCTPQRKRI